VIQLRRALLILLTATVVAFTVMPLGWTAWAGQFRARAQRGAGRPVPVDRAPRAPASGENPVRRRPVWNRPLRPFIGSFVQMGAPAGLTLIVLAVARRRRRAG
jgi:hypothetical protein